MPRDKRSWPKMPTAPGGGIDPITGEPKLRGSAQRRKMWGYFRRDDRRRWHGSVEGRSADYHDSTITAENAALATQQWRLWYMNMKVEADRRDRAATRDGATNSATKESEEKEQIRGAFKEAEKQLSKRVKRAAKTAAKLETDKKEATISAAAAKLDEAKIKRWRYRERSDSDSVSDSDSDVPRRIARRREKEEKKLLQSLKRRTDGLAPADKVSRDSARTAALAAWKEAVAERPAPRPGQPAPPVPQRPASPPPTERTIDYTKPGTSLLNVVHAGRAPMNDGGDIKLVNRAMKVLAVAGGAVTPDPSAAGATPAIPELEKSQRNESKIIQRGWYSKDDLKAEKAARKRLLTLKSATARTAKNGVDTTLPVTKPNGHSSYWWGTGRRYGGNAKERRYVHGGEYEQADHFTAKGKQIARTIVYQPFGLSGGGTAADHKAEAADPDSLKFDPKTAFDARPGVARTSRRTYLEKHLYRVSQRAAAMARASNKRKPKQRGSGGGGGTKAGGRARESRQPKNMKLTEPEIAETKAVAERVMTDRIVASVMDSGTAYVAPTPVVAALRKKATKSERNRMRDTKKVPLFRQASYNDGINTAFGEGGYADTAEADADAAAASTNDYDDYDY